MKNGFHTPLIALTSVCILLAVLPACAPLPSALPEQGNLSLEVRRLSAELVRQERQMSQLAQRLDNTEEALRQQDALLAELRQRLAVAPVARPKLPDAVTTAADAGGGQTPTEIYLQAFGDYASGRYSRAIEGFSNFLRMFPTNSYASNARFWLGDCYFNQQDYAAAIVNFQQGLTDYPQAPRNPDALLKIVMAHLQLGQQDEARQTSDRLRLLYPDSDAAKRVADLLQP
ncbi:MAG: tol-pal system protein YbgF [Desulfuromonadales bacterium]|nr:tol-pal system protein YbgF [Desulfuromonadales bacterium]